MQLISARLVATRPAGRIHDHIVILSHDILSQKRLDNGKLGGSNIKSINIGSQAGERFLSVERISTAKS